jgi:membrane-associated protease RseP (regulator of RpoE activity)
MCRKILAVALGVSLFPWFANQASAQPVKGPNEQIEQIQRQLEALRKQAALQRQPRAAFGTNAFTWGGVRLNPVDAALQEELGLAENEGLVVAQVDADSAAEKAGLKANDVLVKINNKVVASDVDRFSKLVKDQKADEAIDLVVVRDGKEQTLKGAQMPGLVQGGFDGGKGRRPGGFGLGGVNRVPIVKGVGKAGRNLDMNINGTRISRMQNDNEFSGEYSRDDLKITVVGKIDNGVAKTSTITVQDGKDTKTYTSPKDVPEQYRPLLQRIMPAFALRNGD